MASWLTAQLKAAEGLLEAVDKTVSRTVGTLGLAEGEGGDDLTGVVEQGAPRPAAGQYQAAAGSSYSTTYGQTPGAAFPSDSATTAAGSTSGTAAGSHSSASPFPPWNRDGGLTAPTTQPGASNSRYSLDGVGASTHPALSAAGGFTVKTDAPIPFGGPVSALVLPTSTSATSATAKDYQEASSTYTNSLLAGPRPSNLDISPRDAQPTVAPTNAREQPSPPAGALTAAVPPLYGSPAADPSSPLVAAPGRSVPSFLPATFKTAQAIQSPAREPPPGEGVALSSSGGDRPSSGSGAVAATGASSSGDLTASASSVSNSGSTDLLTSRPAQAPPSSHSGSRVSTASTSGTSAGPGGELPAPTSTPAVSQPGSAGAPAVPDAANANSAPVSGSGSAAAESRVSSRPPSSAGGGGGGATDSHRTPREGTSQEPQAATPTVPEATTTASAPAPSTTATTPNPTTTTAATPLATTLAAATTTAVTHSLSFFNLVLDDPADPPAPTSTSTLPGPAAEALNRTIDTLRKRLEASRLENEQLEDMLARAEVRAAQEAAQVGALRQELDAVLSARSTSESSLSAQLAVARSNLADVSSKYETSQRAVLVLEGQVAALQEASRRMVEQQNDREGGMLEALRSELSAAEGRLAAEVRSHGASRAAAASRQQQLEQQIADGTAALADLTRGVEEANRKNRALEDEMVAATRGRNELAAHLTALQRQIVEAGLQPVTAPDSADLTIAALLARPPPGAATPAALASAAAAAAELEVLRGEVAGHQRAVAAARAAAEASGARAATLEEELAVLRATLEQRKDTSQLEAQVREMSDMLYLKQTQMERLAADKAAQQLKTERELEAVRQELTKLSRQHGGPVMGGGGGLPLSLRPTDPSSSLPHDVIPMDALGETFARLTRQPRVGRAVKAAANLLDSTASTASFMLRQYPLVRLGAAAYLGLLHLYVYLLIARMQRMVTHWEGAPGGGAPGVG